MEVQRLFYFLRRCRLVNLYVTDGREQGEVYGACSILLVVSHKFQKLIDILFKVLVLIFLGVLVVYGYQYVKGYARRMIPTLNISYAWVTSSVVVGSALMFVNTVINLVKSIRTPAKQWGEKGGA